MSAAHAALTDGPVEVGAPDHDLLVRSPRRKEVARWREACARGGALVAVQRVEQVALPQVPYLAQRGMTISARQDAPLSCRPVDKVGSSNGFRIRSTCFRGFAGTCILKLLTDEWSRNTSVSRVGRGASNTSSLCIDEASSEGLAA